jgi:hypothetical protein
MRSSLREVGRVRGRSATVGDGEVCAAKANSWREVYKTIYTMSSNSILRYQKI